MPPFQGSDRFRDLNPRVPQSLRSCFTRGNLSVALSALSGGTSKGAEDKATGGRLQSPHSPRSVRFHYLWYRWRNQVLVLSGSASETSQQFEELKSYFEANKELLLKRLNHL